MPHREGQLGRGPQPLEQVGDDGVGGQHGGGAQREHVTLAPAVAGDRHARLHRLLAPLGDVVGQALGGCPHRVDVHPVGARGNEAPHAAGPEFQIPIEPVGQLFLVARGEEVAHFLLVRLLDGAVVEPGLYRAVTAVSIRQILCGSGGAVFQYMLISNPL